GAARPRDRPVGCRGRRCGRARALPVGAFRPPGGRPCGALRFGWDRFWRSDSYYRYPFLARPVLRFLIEGGARLVGVDSINIDDGGDLARPAHSWLLERDIFIVENLCNLAALPAGEPFRLFAVPIRARGAGSMPIRAFAELS